MMIFADRKHIKIVCIVDFLNNLMIQCGQLGVHFLLVS